LRGEAAAWGVAAFVELAPSAPVVGASVAFVQCAPYEALVVLALFEVPEASVAFDAAAPSEALVAFDPSAVALVAYDVVVVVAEADAAAEIDRDNAFEPAFLADAAHCYFDDTLDSSQMP